MSSFKAGVELVDGERAEHVEAALKSMKESLEVLREPSQVVYLTLYQCCI